MYTDGSFTRLSKSAWPLGPSQIPGEAQTGKILVRSRVRAVAVLGFTDTGFCGRVPWRWNSCLYLNGIQEINSYYYKSELQFLFVDICLSYSESGKSGRSPFSHLSHSNPNPSIVLGGVRVKCSLNISCTFYYVPRLHRDSKERYKPIVWLGKMRTCGSADWTTGKMRTVTADFFLRI